MSKNPEFISSKTKKSIEELVKELIPQEEATQLEIIPAHPENNWWEQGYRSNTYRISAQTNGEPHNYFLKEYGGSKACFKDFVTEAAITYISQKKGLNIFPELLSKGNEHFESTRRLLFRALLGENLLSKFEKESPSHNEILIPNQNPLIPVVALHESLREYQTDIDKELKRVSKGVIKSLDHVTPEKHASRFARDVNKVFPMLKSQQEELELIFEKLARDRLYKDKLVTLIQRDGYSKHNFTKQLVDAGAVKYGSRLTHLSCLFSAPPFSRLSYQDIRTILLDYKHKVREKSGIDISQGHLERGYYLSAVDTCFGAAATEKSHGSKERFWMYRNLALSNIVLLNHLHPDKDTINLEKKILEVSRTREGRK